MLGDIIKDNPDIKAILIDGFSRGLTDSEACLRAGISKTTLFDYIKQDPEFGEHKEELKKNPIVKAKLHVESELDKDTTTAKWYLERKTKEFKPPNKDTNITLNQLNLLTESQIKDRLAHKLTKLLDNDSGKDLHTINAEIVEDNSNPDTID